MKQKKQKETIIDKLKPTPIEIIKDGLKQSLGNLLRAVVKTGSNDTDEILLVIDDYQQEFSSMHENDIVGWVSNIIKTTTKVIRTSTFIQECNDSSFASIEPLRSSEIIYDSGIIEAIRATWKLKDLTLERLDKYVVSFVASGSVIKGSANKSSDIDSYVIIDDTDVKRMNRLELQEKLRSIIYELGLKVEHELSLQRKLHTQVWLLTDYWDSIKESSPVMITMLRNSIPLYDKGMFIPWKNLLKMGKIKPSKEAINTYIELGDQIQQIVNARILDLVMEDLCLQVLYPSQALLMKLGEQPPAPKQAVDKLREHAVKQGLLTEADLEILHRAIKLRKAIEYHEVSCIDGKDLQKYIDENKAFLEKIKVAVSQIEQKSSLSA